MAPSAAPVVRGSIVRVSNTSCDRSNYGRWGGRREEMRWRRYTRVAVDLCSFLFCFFCVALGCTIPVKARPRVRQMPGGLRCRSTKGVCGADGRRGEVRLDEVTTTPYFFHVPGIGRGHVREGAYNLMEKCCGNRSPWPCKEEGEGMGAKGGRDEVMTMKCYGCGVM